MTIDKTGTPTTVSAAADKFTIAVDSYAGRGLATILVSEALQQTRAAGKRIVAVCELVASYLVKHRDFDDIVDPVTGETEQFVRAAVHTG